MGVIGDLVGVAETFEQIDELNNDEYFVFPPFNWSDEIFHDNNMRLYGMLGVSLPRNVYDMWLTQYLDMCQSWC